MLKKTSVRITALAVFGLFYVSPVVAEETCHDQYRQVEEALKGGGWTKISAKRRHGVRGQLRQAKEYCDQGKADLAIHYLEVVRSAIGQKPRHKHTGG